MNLPSVQHVVATLIVLSIFYVFILIISRIYFDPLARYPGPVLAKLSGFPNWYHARKGDRHVWLYRLHFKYGSIVRFAPSHISFNTPEAIDDIYKSRKANLIKSDWYQCVRDSAGGFESTFTARDKARHGIKRRLLSHAFSEQALRDYEPRISSLVRKWLDCLEQEAKKSSYGIDMGDRCNYLIFDILGDLCFGASFALMTSAENRSIVKLIPQATKSWYTIGYHPFTHALRYLLFKTRFGSYIGGKSFRNNSRFRDFNLRTLQERRQAESRRVEKSEIGGTKDMFHHLLYGRDPETGQGYKTGDLACESVLLVVAGSQSTSGALAAALFYLSKHPHKLARLRKEIHDSFFTEVDIRYESGGRLATLPYLRACIDETLRLTPPTPGHLPREIVAVGGMIIDGNWFPQRTNVGTSAYSLHRNEAYFSDPSRFLPERWLKIGEGDESLSRAVSAFNPFSAGPTGCIGRQLALMELSLAMALLLWRFDFKMVGETNSTEYQVRDCFVGEGDGPILQLRPDHRPSGQHII